MLPIYIPAEQKEIGMRNVRSKANRLTISRARKGIVSCLFASAAVLGLLATNQAVEQTCTPPAPNMVSWWPGDGNANDIQGSNNGTLEGEATFSAGKVGQAFKFNGNQSDGINLGDVASFNFSPTDSFSVEAWVNVSGVPVPPNDGFMIVSINYQCSNTAQNLAIGAGGTAHFQVRDASGAGGLAISPSALSVNTWHHVAGIREVTGSNKTVKLYIDGVLVASAPDPSTGSLVNSGPDYIGRRFTCGTNNPFNGLIDEPTIYNRALSDAEIQAIYNAGSAGKCKPQCTAPPTGLVSWWPGDGNAFDIRDGNDGTLQNGATFATGKVGQAFSFDGVNDYVRVLDNPNLYPGAGSFSVDAWIKTPPGHPGDIIVHYECGGSCQGGANSLYALGVDPNGKLAGDLRDSTFSSQGLTSTTIVADNAFHHVAMVRDTANSQLLLYVDGVPDAIAALTVTGTIKDD